VCSYSFGPAGATFSPAVTMTLKYGTPLPSGLTEAGLYIAYWDGSTWNKLDSAVNTAAQEVTASVTHFTIFAVRGLPGMPVQPSASTGSDSGASSGPSSGTGASSSADTSATTTDFVLSDLVVTPDTVRAGEKVTISVLAVNGGPSRITGDVALKINGEDRTAQTLTLEKGRSQPVKFIVTESAPGNYAVSVGGLTSEFRVAKDSGFESTSDWSSMAILIVVCVAGLMIAIVLLRDIFTRR
jgi:hypothetical protein